MGMASGMSDLGMVSVWDRDKGSWNDDEGSMRWMGNESRTGERSC